MNTKNKFILAAAVAASLFSYLCGLSRPFKIDASQIICGNPPMISYKTRDGESKVCELEGTGLLVVLHDGRKP